MQEREIFIEALQKENPAERGAYLHAACGADTELRSKVERLLLEHERQQSFILDSPAVGLETAELDPPILMTPPGTVIGRYKLLEPIGEGGYGVVFMAEQTSPVVRKVALKIIKAGMDTRQVIARFEAERQALALMDHPNIAKVFDAGTTDSGRPYFVMELVKGIPITKYCDAHHIEPRQRLELFMQVCQAVQHAHQKGIIHRDLKPSNVLVALYDGKPVPKVIDFGVAKATGQQLTDLTMFTGFGDVIGTLEYMSPEQAEVNQLDVDTRSDIYSLGVLLYELLTGSTPLEHKRVVKAGLLEMLRVVREEEPQRPSTRLNTSEQLPSISANRGLEPRKLSGLVKGELDWIVMKALEKDRGRRYETASGLAMDVQRYLGDEAVQACPPSARYRFGKFARRNKVALAVSGLVLFFLVLLGSGIGWAARDRAAREAQFDLERTSRQAKVSGQLDLILADVARLEQAEKWSEALLSARRAEPGLAAGEAPPDIQERVRQVLADLELVHRLDEIRAQSGTIFMWWNEADPTSEPTIVRTEQGYAKAVREVGIDVDALSVEEAARRISARSGIAAALLPALDDWLAVRSICKDQAATRRLIDVLGRADPDPWRQRVRDALVGKDWPALGNLVTSADLDRQPAATLYFLSGVLRAAGKSPEVELVLRRAQWKYPADFWINHRLGVDLMFQRSPSPDDIQEGIGYLRAAVAARPESDHAIMNLGNGYAQLGQHDQAIACYRKALELGPDYWSCYSNLGIELAEIGQYGEAITAFERVIKDGSEVVGEDYSELSMIHSNRRDSHLRDARRAVELANKAVELEPKFSNNWVALGIALFRDGQWQEARSAFDRAQKLGASAWRGSFRWEQGIDWFFVAMCHWQLAQTKEARQCYDKGVALMEKNPPNTERLVRARVEAAELLKITDQRPTTKPQSN